MVFDMQIAADDGCIIGYYCNFVIGRKLSLLLGFVVYVILQTTSLICRR